MQIKASEVAPASRDRVWAALNDPAVLKKCIPGCEKLEPTAPNEMTAFVVLKIGPLKTAFSGKLTLCDVEPARSYRLVAEGVGGAAGFASGWAAVTLTAQAPETTRLDYVVDVGISGRLAKLGGFVIEAAARRLARDFFARFVQVVRAS